MSSTTTPTKSQKSTPPTEVSPGRKLNPTAAEFVLPSTAEDDNMLTHRVVSYFMTLPADTPAPRLERLGAEGLPASLNPQRRRAVVQQAIEQTLPLRQAYWRRQRAAQPVHWKRSDPPSVPLYRQEESTRADGPERVEAQPGPSVESLASAGEVNSASAESTEIWAPQPYRAIGKWLEWLLSPGAEWTEMSGEVGQTGSSVMATMGDDSAGSGEKLVEGIGDDKGDILPLEPLGPGEIIDPYFDKPQMHRPVGCERNLRRRWISSVGTR